MHVCLLGLMAAGGIALSAGSSLAGIDNQPVFVAPEDKPIPKGTRVDVIADTLTYDDKTKIATATGTVQLTYGPYVMTATKVVYNMQTKTFSANGSIVLKEPNGNVLEADSATLKDTFKEGFADHVRALLTNNVTITAQYARRYANGITIYEHASYTACKTCVTQDGTPVWQIVAREAKHDSKGQTIYYKDAQLKFGNVPVFFSPYFEYPDPTVKRRTGLLLPSIRWGEYGFGVTTPYFWAIDRSTDMTFSPMWTTRNGPLADLQFRKALAAGAVSFEGWGIYEFSKLDNNAHDTPWRGAARAQSDFRINDKWTWGWDGTVVSDKQFMSDYGIDPRNMLASYVQATGLDDRNYTKAQIIGWRSLVDGEDQGNMPIATPFITGDYVLPEEVLGGEFSYGFNYYTLERRNAIDTISYNQSSYSPGANTLNLDLGTNQTHMMAYADWQRQMISRQGVLVTPFASVRGDGFLSKNVPTAEDDSTSDFSVLPTAGIDTRMPFVTSMGGYESVLTPVVQFIASPSEPNQRNNGNEDAITFNFDTSNLFLSDKFTGYDRWEGGVRANAGVQYTLLSPSGGFLRASLGESFHIAGDNSYLVGSGLDGTSSDMVGAIALQFNPNISLGYQARWEEDFSRVNVQEASLGLNFSKFSGSISYADISKAANYGRPDNEKQVWGNGRYYLSDAWSVFGSARYDVFNGKPMGESLGVTFDCDCMKAELVYSMSHTDQFGVSDNGTEYRIDLSVELRTIGTLAGGFVL
ncbi:MAG: LPS-assembly protein LptD [Aestuariivirga sp.]|uniref:LPS-assembly protein LptD n=1 Tax=Aestuariivirga sp. TaxID=2650926 RepID=UPI0025C3741C|nr:LPS assembly protein LptD [Aestuariivirga sp.]MCA3561633.1 LPS-assembly protein LptD [Aestuariivirga sp.]